MPQATLEAPHKALGEAEDLVGDAAGVHHIGGKDKQGHRDNGVVGVKGFQRLLGHHLHGFAGHHEIEDAGHHQPHGDGHAQDEHQDKDNQKNDQCQAHACSSLAASSMASCTSERLRLSISSTSCLEASPANTRKSWYRSTRAYSMMMAMKGI